MDGRKFDLAGQWLQRSLGRAKAENSKEHIYNTLRVLARLTVQTEDLVKASEYADQALHIARESGNHADELYPLLVQGQVAARRGDTAVAETEFRDIERDKSC